MSVRDKIAGFGGAATASRPGISSRPNSHHNNGFARNDPLSGGGGGKLRVPDVFKNATKPADVPAAAASSAGHPSSSSSSSSSAFRPISSSSAPAKKWGAPSAGASNETGVSANGGPANGNCSSGSSNGGGGGGGASQWKAQSGAGSGAGAGTGTGAASRTARRNGSGETKKPRDILGIGAVMSAGSSSSLARLAAPVPAATLGDSSSRNGGSSDLTKGRASPTGRSNKPKAGPRKLNLTRISAEKQRAALGLDKDLDEENNDGGAPRPSGGGDSASAAKPVNGAGTSFNNSSASASSSSYSKPAASSYSKPATASSSRPASGRVGGGAAGSTGGAKLPSAGSLRSSGHNLW